MEKELDLTNVVYLDEYPNLRKKVWLKRLSQERQVGETALTLIIPFPRATNEDY